MHSLSLPIRRGLYAFDTYAGVAIARVPAAIDTHTAITVFFAHY